MKNFIPALHVDGQVIADQHGKERAFFNAYRELLGRDEAHEHSLDLEALGIQAVDLMDQELIFSEEEIWQVVKEMTSDRASGLDGFIGLFFKRLGRSLKEI